MASMVDLHIHTTASDGSDSPPVLAEKIAAAGLKLFSVTDHDTIDGARAMETLVPVGVRYIPGVEFSCWDPAGKCHILGYGCDHQHPAFRAALEEGRRLRLEKLHLRVQRLEEEFGVVLTNAEAEWLARQNSPGKPHLGRILLERGMAENIDEAIRRYLKNVPARDRIDAKTAVKAILASGGVPVWAHPLGGEGEKRLIPEKFEKLLETLIAYGIRGMECHYSRYSPEEAVFLEHTARERGLLVTGGSDYHGSNKRGITLGGLGSHWNPEPEKLFAALSRK